MSNEKIAKELLGEASAYHGTLIDLARGIDRFHQIMEFIVRCIEFAENYVQEDRYSDWLENNPYIPLMHDRTRPLFTFESKAPLSDLDHLLWTTTSGSTHAFSFLMDNYNYYETKDSRDQFLDISLSYRDLLSRPEDIEFVHMYLAPLNTVADEKFNHSIESMASLPQDEDPQGPLLEMRSAIDLTLDILLKHTPLSRRQRGDLKSVQFIPSIAKHLAKNDLSQVDLLMANRQFEQLKSKLAAAKNIRLPRDHAETLMAQAVALLSQIAKSVEFSGDKEE